MEHETAPRTFIHVSRGQNAAVARDMVVIEDPALVARLAQIIAHWLAPTTRSTALPLRPVPPASRGPGEEQP